MFIPGIVVTAPDTQHIFYGENDNRNNIEIIEKVAESVLNRRHSLQHDSCDVQNDQCNNENIEDLIPVLVTHDLRVKDIMDIFFDFVIHPRSSFSRD
jgi:hypothetical protein